MWWQCSTMLKVKGLNEQFEQWTSCPISYYLDTWRKWTHSKGEAILGESKARDWISGPFIPGYGLYTIWTVWSKRLNHSSEKPCPSAKQHLITMWIITRYKEDDPFPFSLWLYNWIFRIQWSKIKSPAHNGEVKKLTVCN